MISLQELHGLRAGRGPVESSAERRGARLEPRTAGAARSGGCARVSRRGAARRLPTSSAPDAEGPPIPARASSTCSPRASAGAGETTSAPTCRAPSRTRARDCESDGLALSFLLEAVGPGTERLGAARAGGGAGAGGTARGRLPGPGGGHAGAARRRRHRRRAAPLPRTTSCPTPACCSASAPPPTPQAAALFSGSPEVVTDDGSVGRRALVTEPLASGARRGPRAPRCSPAGRRRCSRPSARSARSAACRPSWRSSPAWPAATAPASAASSRRRRLRPALRRRAGARRGAARDGDGPGGRTLT